MSVQRGGAGGVRQAGPDIAAEAMLNSYAAKAKLRDGQSMLDLGCGWGSLSLWLAARFPGSQITALSNSRTQKLHIDATAKQRGLKNLTVVTGDVKEYQFKEESFDRILSIEMFEHVRPGCRASMTAGLTRACSDQMKNYALLFQKVSTWLKRTSKDAGEDEKALLFIHIFCHRTTPYHFEEGDGWMTKHFFEGRCCTLVRMCRPDQLTDSLQAAPCRVTISS